MNDNARYWIWLQRAVGKGANLERLLTPYRGDVRAFFDADPAEREERLRATDYDYVNWPKGDLRAAAGRAGLPPAAQKRPRRPRPIAEGTLRRLRTVGMDEVEEVLRVCEREGIVPLCPEDGCYPRLLREIPTRPAVLYALGDASLLSGGTLPLAMVGARDARLTSLSAASDLAGTLSRAGFLVVSGGALGTDAACHIGALNAGSPTVAVLGTGIGTRYLMQNADLRRVIAKNGVLLSEMEPGEPGSRGSFPLRNRIIAGMSVGTLVVEAAIKSGSLITSKYAEEFDRDVFVPKFPGVDPEKPLAPGVPNTAFRGTAELLERETGRGICCAMDVLVEYIKPYEIDLLDLLKRDRLGPDDLLRDVTVPAGRMPPLLSQQMIVKARAQLTRDAAGALIDLAGEGTLNAAPGWGPYRTATDAEEKVYTSAEFTYRRGDHPLNYDPERADADIRRTRPEKASAQDGSSAACPARPSLSVEVREALIAELSDEALRVARAFERAPDRTMYYEDLERELDMAPQYLLAALTVLQIKGLVDIRDDERYSML